MGLNVTSKVLLLPAAIVRFGGLVSVKSVVLLSVIGRLRLSVLVPVLLIVKVRVMVSLLIRALPKWVWLLSEGAVLPLAMPLELPVTVTSILPA